MRPKFEGKHADITEQIIKCCYEIHKHLGYGFLEKVYENAIVLLGRNAGLAIEQQIKVPVFFQGVLIGEYHPDVIVNRLVIVEVKAGSSLAGEHEAQLLYYLKATPIEVGLLVNFGPKLEIKRKVFDNSL